MNPETDTQLIPATTVTQLVGTFREASMRIVQAFDILVDVEKSLNFAFGQEHGRGFDLSYLMDPNRGGHQLDFDESPKLIDRIKLQAWRVLVDRMELRRCLSIERARQLDKQLETGEGLPELTEDGIGSLMLGTMQNVMRFKEEAVIEVFERLRPHRHRDNGGYKTNSSEEVEAKVILSWWIERNYSGRGFRVRYNYDAELRALDNVFHQLDGKGIVKTHNGPLHDAIESSANGVGETDYFSFKCFKNGNFHLTFKRLDLLAELNRIGGGNRLKRSRDAAQ